MCPSIQRVPGSRVFHNTEFPRIQNTVQSKPVFDPKIQSELRTNDKCTDIKTGNLESVKITLMLFCYLIDH